MSHDMRAIHNSFHEEPAGEGIGAPYRGYQR